MSTTLSAEDDTPRRGRGSPAEVVAASGLPPELGNLVLGVTGKCRLWQRERTDVARELCSHFREGLEAGATPDTLASAFGEPERTAALITRSRKRLRPLWWRAARQGLRGTGVLFATLMLVYVVLAARFFWRSPNVARNFTNELNAPVLASRSEDRAWPLYIRARIEFGAMPDFMLNSDHPDPRRVGEPGWDQMIQWLDAHEGALKTVREAASKPVLGYVLRSTTDPEFAKALELTTPHYKHDPSAEVESENPMLIGVLLPHLGEMRRSSRWLTADANLALSRGDGDRYLADVRALLGMARQAAQDEFLISDLVGLAIANLTFSTVLETAATGGVLSDAQLRGLAHEIAGFSGGRISLDMHSETLMVEDILQRFYSDDGGGDGHRVGGPALDQFYSEWGVPRPKGLPLLQAAMPVMSVAKPSRRGVAERLDAFVATARVDDGRPPWEHHLRASDGRWADVMNSGVYDSAPFLKSLMQSLSLRPMASAFQSRDLTETARDAAITAMAMELFRRDNGRWPHTLAELVPKYLPSVMRDPCTGGPIRFLAAADRGSPLLYSVGVDGVDEGGRLPQSRRERQATSDLSRMSAPGLHPTEPPPAGDWILWPVPPEITDPAN